MPRLMEKPTVVEAAGNKRKQIQEFAGRVSSRYVGWETSWGPAPGKASRAEERGRGSFDGGFARVPNLGTWSPVGKYIPENEGFTPDVEVQVLPRDDFAGRDPQPERAVQILLQKLERNPPPPVPPLETVERSGEVRPGEC